jgi:hypothetical protein
LIVSIKRSNGLQIRLLMSLYMCVCHKIDALFYCIYVCLCLTFDTCCWSIRLSIEAIESTFRHVKLDF